MTFNSFTITGQNKDGGMMFSDVVLLIDKEPKKSKELYRFKMHKTITRFSLVDFVT